MKLTKVKIFGTEYNIKYVDKINDIVKETDKIKLRTEVLGLCYPRYMFWEQGKIIVKISEDADKTAETVFHEITHTLFNEMIIESRKHRIKLNQLNNDEEFIQKFSEALRDIIESLKRDKTK